VPRWCRRSEAATSGAGEQLTAGPAKQASAQRGEALTSAVACDTATEWRWSADRVRNVPCSTVIAVCVHTMLHPRVYVPLRERSEDDETEQGRTGHSPEADAGHLVRDTRTAVCAGRSRRRQRSGRASRCRRDLVEHGRRRDIAVGRVRWRRTGRRAGRRARRGASRGRRRRGRRRARGRGCRRRRRRPGWGGGRR
jgi:hypothetical protein